MAPTLPPSLSPHICVLASPDLQELLAAASLPPLSQILQSFTPLTQVTTRTTTLTSVPHTSFALRFSELPDIEAAAREDEEQRAGRTMDWIGARVASRAVRWVELVEAAKDDRESPWRTRTPWWEEVKRCIEGDHVPNKMEGWNHPVAIIYAVSTLAANPLQGLQDMHTRAMDLPPWVDSTHLRCSLIVHPSSSPLPEPITESLFNAVKKQYGLHSYFLPLSLPTSPPPEPANVPPPTPRLPPISSMAYSPVPPAQVPATLQTSLFLVPGSTLAPALALTNGTQEQERPIRPPTPKQTPGQLYMNEGDIQQTGRFVREFAVMSLLPWMEKCVVDWNEIYSSSRRLPSRLFSSTKRLFGSGYSSNTSSTPSTPTHGSSPSLSSVAGRFASHAPNSSVSSLSSVTSMPSAVGGLVTQQRRLAEFATILGDYKLAMSVWETLRKESKGGSDVLPLLLSPSPALALHASNAITILSILANESPALAQLRALVYAVRWDISIDAREFLGSILEGDRWFVQAAGTAEEPPMALLLGHAAFLSIRRSARRRAALWYLFAADRLEKAGIKPLALYFFRQAHQLYRNSPTKELSPAFWEGEGKDPADWEGFEAILPGIEHELGRLLYTTGDTESAVKYFLGLLRGSPPQPMRPPTMGLGLTQDGDVPVNGKALPAPADRVYLEDFRVALKHFEATEGERWAAADLKLSARFCQPKQTRIRLPGDAVDGDQAVWSEIEEEWAAFWRPRGKERLEQSGKAAVDESFWVDLALYNPLDVEITISNLMVIVKDAKSPDAQNPLDFVETELVDEISLGAHETRTIPVAIKCSQPASLLITHTTFIFLSLLPVTEPLALPGRRLHDTPQQRQNKVYAPDTLIRVDVEDASQRLQAYFVDDRHLVLAQGENRQMQVRLMNSGRNRIDEVWVVSRSLQEVWVDVGESGSSISSVEEFEVLHSSNSITHGEPFRIPLGNDADISSLEPGESISLSIYLHAAQQGEHDLSLLLVFREANSPTFHSTRLMRHFEVRPILDVSTTCEVGWSNEHPYIVHVDVTNLTASSDVLIYQVSTLSPIWTCSRLSADALGNLLPCQSARIPLGVDQWEQRTGQETRDFVARQLRAVLLGETVAAEDPPPIDVLCRHLSKDRPLRTTFDAATRHFIHATRRRIVCSTALSAHPHIPVQLHRFIFPLYSPSALDVLVFWAIPAQGRSGHTLVTGLTLGAGHATLREILAEARSDAPGGKGKRSMYAETVREKAEAVEGVRCSEWNREADPIAVNVKDGVVTKHDFKKGPARVLVAFTLRNLSVTNPARFILRLSARELSNVTNNTIPSAPYTGKLTHKGQLAPLECATVEARLWVSRPGVYALDAWSVETEVGEVLDAPDFTPESPPSESGSGTTRGESLGGGRWRTRQRYEQGPPAGVRSYITIVDISQV